MATQVDAVESPFDTTGRSSVGTIARSLTRAIQKRPLASVAGVYLLVLVTAAIVAPLLPLTDPLTQDYSALRQDPSRDHPFGTDDLGRDTLSRTIHGSRISLAVAFGSAAFALTIGTAIGLVTGYSRGIADMLVQRIIDALMTLPGLILAIVLSAVIGVGLGQITLAIGIAHVGMIARISRSTALSVSSQDYVLAAKSIGASAPRIMLRYILPNSLAPIIVFFAYLVAVGILTEASLGFLGLSVTPPTPTWGNLLGGRAREFLLTAPWMSIAPGIFIVVTVLALNIASDRTRDALDPTLKGD